MQQITVPAYGKINLTLDITGKREDGYHELVTLMQQVELHDDVRIRLSPKKKISVLSDHESVPRDAANIAYRAAQELLRFAGLDLTGLNYGIDIFIAKRIPVEGGMAGGSANAAAVLKGLNRLLNLNLSTEELMRIGLRLGADVPYCIFGGTAVARGIGEILTRVPSPPTMWMVLVKPDFGVSTALVYKNFSFHERLCRPDLDLVLKGIERGEIVDIYRGMGNVLESVTLRLYPVLQDIKRRLVDWGAEAVLMSGSGPTVCAFTRSPELAKDLCATAQRNFPASYRILTTNTISVGEAGNILARAEY
ncbi:4-diphosphocytidyl-2-C-methyl-D-erythritol kinase [Thermincola ferriacetica]|uniref:4-diphosphocytidyl-2-C-methyl-D-erythritol kinase n=1 Tax=Thermincola ferriacetica TaxID=281456 RepID=A0A0L6W2A6_9FIRM|nr:4-(cytidine 5'-diphospho)-2-C-methyl-D-erythritol kinase [Thermincola ferriacetica]KNZ69214.1 4-diphosphocytidyl-2-C-methyl-D-erythritol kinase [Thermincola ferriacetica]